MKPDFKIITDFNNFFEFIQIDIKEVIINDKELGNFFDHDLGQYLKRWPAPGLFIYLNGLEASSMDNYSYNSSFARFFKSIQTDLIDESSKEY